MNATSITRRSMALLTCLVILFIDSSLSYCWLPREAAEWAIQEYSVQEGRRMRPERPDMRSSSPFITGNGFRDLCHHRCDDRNRCIVQASDIHDGEFVFIKSDYFMMFVNNVLPKINAKIHLIIHNGDLSAPDGQSEHEDALGMKPYNTSETLLREYRSGKVLSIHAQNLWWFNTTIGSPRPESFHCLPIGLENRQYSIGQHPDVYVEALRKYVLNRVNMTLAEERKKPLLLVAFGPRSYAPDRMKVLRVLNSSAVLKTPQDSSRQFYVELQLTHKDWLLNINQFRFVLAPFGHGLDTHRISEILLMGGIPVLRRSSISSCYDNSDNVFNGKSRGSIPVVILDSWEDLTEQRLEREWDRITSLPLSHWDWRRVFINQWLDRVGLLSANKTEI